MKAMAASAFALIALSASFLARAEETPAPAAPAKGLGLNTSFFKGDQPIEITADQLDVDQEHRTAIFDGNVNAVQGDIQMRADRLTVFYDEGAGSEPVAGSSDGKIKRMEVDGGVHLSSPTETASGETGVYDVTDGKITLRGHVVLTRGQNVLRGTMLSIDVASGYSVIEGGKETGGRVKGLFVPKGTAKSAEGTDAQGSGPAP